MSRFLIIRNIVVFMTVMLMSIVLVAQTFVQPCVSDTRINRNDGCASWQTTNYGSSTTMQSATWTWVALGCTQGDIRALLQFDMNPTISPQALYDNRATLNLYFPPGSTETQSYVGAATDNQFYVQQVTSNWSELATTWNTQPTITTTGQITVPSSVSTTQDYSINVSSLVYNWICNGATNNGIRLQQVNEGNTYRRVTFCSKEYADPLKHPTMTLEYAYIAASAPDTICGGGTFNINCSLTNANNPSGYSFQWLHQNSGTTYTTQNVSNPTTIAGLNTYIVTVTNPWCQTAKDTVTVFIDNSSAISVSPSTAYVCPGGSTTLVASGASTYSWSNSLGSGASQTVSPTTNTTYTVTGTTAAGCTSTASATVNINAVPTVSVSVLPTSNCPGLNTTLTASGAAVYSWSTGAGTTSITVSPSSTTTYTVTGTNALGCTATASGTVTVNPNPTVSASASPASVCPGNPSTLTGSGASTYAWSTGASGTTTTVNPTSTTSYTVTGTSAAGCTGTATVSVTVLAGPIVTTTGATICEGETANISASGATNYAWDNNMNGGSISVTPTTTTTYTVSGTDGGGCTGLATATVIVNPLPTISVNQPSICSGTTANLTASGASTYVWSTSDITASIQVSPLATTSYVVTGTDANGCENTASATVTVNPNPVVNVISTPDYCASANGTAAANAISGTMPYDYLWNTSQTTATISSLPAGQYNVTVSDANGCTESGVVTVSPQAGFTLGANSTQEHCDMLDGTAEIVASNATMPLNYSWSHNIGLNSPIANGLAAGSYSVTVTDGQCTLTIEVTVGFHDGPNAGFHPSSTTTNAGEGNITFSDQSTGALIWYYEFGDGGISTEQNPIYQYLTPGVYYPMQVVADQFGCTDTAYQTINANEGFAFFIPSAFSPNGDGRNDFFTVSGYGIDLNTFQMSIYDRWGHIVFRTSDINKQWDGQYFMSEEIDDVTQGVYSYHITFKTSSGKDKNYFGHVVKLP